MSKDNIVKVTLIVILALGLGACSGGGSDNSNDCRFNEAWVNGSCVIDWEDIFQGPSTGGIWNGIDSDGGEVLAFVTESGRFHLFDNLLNQGAGTLSVDVSNQLLANFEMVPLFGFTFADGTTSANCNLSGVVSERQTMNVTINCTTTAGLDSQIAVLLDYDALYDDDSSLATIAGNFDDGAGTVLNVNADGTIFEQDPVSGCIINGQISMIDSAYNAYDVAFDVSNCGGNDAVLNGSNFNGLAAVDNTGVPEILFIAATGDVAGDTVSLAFVWERL